MNKTIVVTAPGKLIVSGEWALLAGYSGISMAINRIIEIKITKLDEEIVKISSNLGYFESKNTDCNDIPDVFKVFYHILKKFEVYTGIEISIKSSIPHDVGFGSSGACIACMVAGLMVQKNEVKNMTLDDKSCSLILQNTLEVSYEIYGHSSGVDIGNSIYGSLISFNPNTLEVNYEKLDIFDTLNCYAVFTGYKTKTPDMIARMKNEKQLNMQICKEISECTNKLKVAIEQNDQNQFIEMIHENQILLQKLGVSDENIDSIVKTLFDNGIKGAKISGSGCGDSVIVFTDKKSEEFHAKMSQMLPSYKVYDITINKTGLMIRYE